MKRFLLTFLFCCVVFQSYSQEETAILFTVDDVPVFVSEFKSVFEKNLNQIAKKEKNEVEKYLELYVNYKLKLAEAKALQLDKTPAHKREIQTYKNQLIAPYLRDSSFLNKLVKDAYYRTKYKVKASHILVKLSNSPSPKDTLVAYQKIVKARKEILDGKAFAKVAMTYSEDLSVKKNYGDLGYFTAFKMVYPFENAAYQTKKGAVSMPFKTRFGYHIVQVDAIELSEGEVEVAHLLIADVSQKGFQQVEALHTRLKNGVDFEQLVKEYSNDKSTKSNQGRVPKFGIGRMPKEFETAAFLLEKTGSYSKPIKTQFGWHIIKLIKKHPVGSFSEMKSELLKKVKASGGARMSDLAVINRLKNEYQIKLIQENVQIFYQKNIRGAQRVSLNKILLKINDKPINQDVFFDYIRNRRHKSIDDLLNEFVNEEVLNYYKEQLELNEPKFANTLKTYKEGLLIFDFMQQEIWDKATKDTEGLQQFFNSNKDKYHFNKLSENKGTVINDYQTYLEKKVLNGLKEKYPVKIHTKVLKKIIKYYKNNA